MPCTKARGLPSITYPKAWMVRVFAGRDNLWGAPCEYPCAAPTTGPPVFAPYADMATLLPFLLETLVRSTLMPKDKKKHSKKDAASADVLDLAHDSLKKFRKVTREIGKLSTGQKLVGGLALAAAGLVYLAARDSSDPAPMSEPDASHAAPAATGPGAAGAPRKHPKRARFAAEA